MFRVCATVSATKNGGVLVIAEERSFAGRTTDQIGIFILPLGADGDDRHGDPSGSDAGQAAVGFYITAKVVGAHSAYRAVHWIGADGTDRHVKLLLW